MEPHKSLTKILRTIGNSECLEKSKQLASDDNQTSTLNLRNLSLKSIDITAIAPVLNQEYSNAPLKSISFSYNRLIGDEGVTVLIKSLPISLQEIGLVDCGIGDNGGRDILNFVRTLPQLKMICIERNNFSNKLKQEYKTFGNNNPTITVVV